MGDAINDNASATVAYMSWERPAGKTGDRAVHMRTALMSTVEMENDRSHCCVSSLRSGTLSLCTPGPGPCMHSQLSLNGGTSGPRRRSRPCAAQAMKMDHNAVMRLPQPVVRV